MRTDWKPTLLVSYAYWRSAGKEDAEILVKASLDGQVELLLDSGAFTALNAGKEISLPEYMSFVKRHDGVFVGCMQLDKLGDPETSERNLITMLDAGLRPIPIHVRGDNRQRMDQLFGLSDWVALGGFRRPHRGPAPKSYVKLKMEWARGRNVHWLGYVDVKMVSAFRPYSVDCSSWAGGHLYGTMAMYQGNGRWARINRRDKARHRLEPWQITLLSECGFSAADFYNDKNWGKHKHDGVFGRTFMLMMVNVVSWLRFSREIRHRFGTRLFLALALRDDELDCFVRGMEIVHAS